MNQTTPPIQPRPRPARLGGALFEGKGAGPRLVPKHPVHGASSGGAAPDVDTILHISQEVAMKSCFRAALAVTLFIIAAAPALAEPTLDWTRDVTDSSGRIRWGVSGDGLGNVYTSGIGSDGAKVAKYDAAGSLLWSKTLDPTIGNGGWSASADRLGNVYISGIVGPLSAGGAFVAKYDDAGNLLWTRQYGAGASSGVSADGLGNVYMSSDGGGSISLVKYDAGGDFLWTQQLFVAGGIAPNTLVSADGVGNVYIGGRTNGDLGGPNLGAPGSYDAWMAKYDEEGNLLWTRQFGTAVSDGIYGLSADALGNVYASGYTRGDLFAPYHGSGAPGDNDTFVAKFDGEGNLVWGRQLDDPDVAGAQSGVGRGVSADGLGNVYLSGIEIVAKYDTAGNQVWSHVLSGRNPEPGISADGLGNIFVSRNTGIFSSSLTKLFDGQPGDALPGDFNRDGAVDGGDFLAWQQGLGAAYDADDLNAWRAHFGATTAGAAAVAPFPSPNAPVPEPSSLALAGPALALLLAARNRWRVSPKLAAILGENRQPLGRFAETADPSLGETRPRGGAAEILKPLRRHPGSPRWRRRVHVMHQHGATLVHCMHPTNLFSPRMGRPGGTS